MPHDPVVLARRAQHLADTSGVYGNSMLGDVLIAARETKQMTRSELAARVGVKVNTIWRWESGKSPIGDDDDVTTVADVLGIDPYKLYDAMDRIPPHLADAVRRLPYGDMRDLDELLERRV